MPITASYWEQACNELSKNDHIMAEIISKYKGETLTRRGDAFVTLARSITGQQISVKAAASVWNKAETLLGDITPETIIKSTDDELRSAGYSRQKVSYLNNIAESFANGAISGEMLDQLEDEEAIKELIKLKGIGRWTAEMFLIFHMLRPDVFPIDDLGLQKAIELHYGVEKADIHSVGDRWKPYRSVATWYLWRSLDPEPVEY